MLKPQSNNKNIEAVEEKDLDLSDISYNTDSNVFKGAFLFKKLNENKPDSNTFSRKSTYTKKHSEEDPRETTKDSEKDNKNPYPSKTKTAELIQQSPLSFRPNSKQIIHAMIEHSHPETGKSRTAKSDLTEKDDSSNVERKILTGNEDCGLDNIYWDEKLKDTECIERSNLEYNPRTSRFSCTLSRVSQGLAYFVTEGNVIFSLPRSFLPLELKIGICYDFNVSQSLKLLYKRNAIQKIQKGFVVEE